MIPKVSIVIAVRDEEKTLPKVIPTLVNQYYYPKDYEIIFVDCMSKDKTRKILEGWKKKSKVKIRILSNQKQDSGSGRNIGILHAKGRYIMQLSGHVLAAPNLLKVLATKLDEQPSEVAGVGCMHKDPEDSSQFQIAAGKVLYSKLGGIGTSQHQSSEDRFVKSVSYTLYRRRALKEVGMNNSEFKIGQDAELNIRLREKGYKLLYTPETFVGQYKRNTYKGLAKQMFWYGWARTHMIRKHPREFSPLYLVPSALVLFFPVFAVLGFCSHLARTILGCGAFAYLLPVAFSSSALAGNFKEWARIFSIYFVVHFSYGAGFLWGLVF